MEKRILLNNISSLQKNENDFYKRYIKNMNIDIHNNSILSILSNDSKERKIIGKIIAGEIKPNLGTVNYIGDYFNNKKDYRGEKIGFISNEFISNIKQDKTISSFLRENISNKKFLNISYKEALKEAEREIESLQKEKSELLDKNTYLIAKSKARHQEYLETILNKDEGLKNENNLNEELKNLKENYKANNKEIRSAWKSTDAKTYDLKNFFQGKEKLQKIELKKFITKIKETKKREWDELKFNEINEERDIDSLIYNRAHREVSNLIKFIHSFKVKQICFSKEFTSLLERIVNIQNKEKFYEELKILLDDVKNVSKYTNPTISGELNDRVNFIKQILDPKSAINSLNFNNLLDTIYKRYDDKVNYFKNVIKDIELKLAYIDEQDKKERIGEVRKIWEFKTISLRFQAQIFRERISLLEDKLSDISSIALYHSKENFNEFYDLIIESEKIKSKISIALNRFRFQREANILKLEEQVKKEILANENIRIKESINEINASLRYKGLFKAISNSIIRDFSNRPLFNMENDLVEEEKIIIDERVSAIDEKIEEKQNHALELAAKINPKDLQKEELHLTYLLDDISFSLDDLEIKVTEISTAQKQRLSLVKAALEGKEVIMIEDPKYDLDLKTDSEIAVSIKRISERSNIMIILLTDDYKLASVVSNRVAFVFRGSVFEKGSFKKISKNPIHPYTKWIIERNKQNKFIADDEYNGEALAHNLFTPLENFEVSDDHIVLCTQEELEKWR